MIISRQLSEFIGEGKHKLRPESQDTAPSFFPHSSPTPLPIPPPHKEYICICIDWAALGLIDAHTSYSISINGLIRNQFV